MNILFAASECVPFCKTGGLADVVGALTPVLKEQGNDVRVIMPLYSKISEQYKSKMQHVVDFDVQLGWRKQYCGIESLEYKGVTFYFVDNKYYFGRDYVYGLGGDECERFGFFCRAVLNALPLVQFKPDVLHAHDWQSGMIPALLKIQYQHLPFYQDIKCVYTIHNLQYQGIFAIEQMKDIFGLSDEYFTSDKLEHFTSGNFMKAGIVYADEITTVSPSYAEEIQTAYYGERLDGLLRAKRAHLSGVLNGIDVDEYDPKKDALIPFSYSVDDLEGKKQDKLALQKQLGLEENADVPIIGMVGRLSNQKGLDLIDYIIGELMQENIQLVVLGMGDAKYFNLFSWAEQHYPKRVAARFQMDHELAHRIYAGADIFLMPSQFEPCGLSQMIALRYGTVPVVRETGGLRDTVLAYNEANSAGNGFTFFNYNAHDMLYTLRRALYFYFDRKDVWSTLVTRGMSGDYSWTHSARTYLSLYENVLQQVKEELPVVKEEVQEKPAPKKRAPRKAPAPKTTEAQAEKDQTEEKPKKAPAKRAPKKTTEEEKPVAKKRAPKKTTEKVEEKASAEGEKKPVKRKTPAKKEVTL